MSSEINGWGYFESVNGTRCAALEKHGSFEELVADVLEDVRVIRALAETGRDPGLTGCLRPVFHIELPKTGDALFNGRSGYRAQYWIDPWHGLTANAILIASLKPRLMAAVNVLDQPALAKIDISASLDAVSSKIWISEAPATLTGNRDLNVEPWLSEAARGVELARLGLSAPAVSRFEVQGALLDAFGHEHVPSRKLRRHHDLHHYGFA
jgi:hypothetical protein